MARNKTELIKSWMENYPEAGAGNSMKCHAFNYEKTEFTFVDEETEEYHSVNLKSLMKGLKVFIELIEKLH